MSDENTIFAAQTNTISIMKQLLSFFFAALFGAGLMSSCTPKQPAETAEDSTVGNTRNLVESNSMVGLWQQVRTTEVVDEASEMAVPIMKLRPRYKCIMPDGTYYLLDVKVDSDGVATSTILHYGTYEFQDSDVMLEHIVNCSTDPNLAGITSTVRYTLVDVNTISIYYNFGLEGGSEEGANEWVPETWKRVGMN